MNAYSGNEPFVFVSYSHLDNELAEKIITGLKQSMCRVWYDEGLSVGESWNDKLADRINNAEAFIVILSQNSVESQFVRKEVNYAISKQKAIYPIMVNDFDVSAGLEMLLCDTQYFKLRSGNEVELEYCLEEIIAKMPPSVISKNRVPFLEKGNYAFYLEKDCRLNGAKDKHADSFTIVCRDSESEETVEMFDFKGSAAYDIDYEVTQCNATKDDYFVGEIHGLYVFNVLAQCELDYPLIGVDLDLLLVFVLRIADDETPMLCMVDYQFINVHRNKEKDTELDSWGKTMLRLCKEKLFGR